jgi:diguanylate cyclase (GGDEF)-like protein
VRGRRATHVGAIHRRLHRYVGTVAAAGSVCLVMAAVSVVHSPPDNWRAVGLAVAAMTIGRLMALRVRFGNTTIQFDWAEAALIIAVVLVPGPVVVLGAAVAVSAVMLWRRTDPLKHVFNVATTVITASVVTFIVHALAPGPKVDPMTTAGALAILAGISTYPLLNDFAVAVAISRDRGLSAVHTFVEERSTWLVTFLGNVTAAFGVLALVHASAVFVVLCAPVIWLVHQAYIGRSRARLERAAWQRLAAAIHGLSRLEESEVIGAAVRGAADLFGADVVEIETVDGAGTRRLTRGDAGGYLWSGAPGGEARTESTVLSVPLADRRGAPIGELRLCFGTERVLGERDELALASFADALVSALRNAQVLDRLRAEASRNEHDATHDSLTGLPNRTCLLDRGESLRRRRHEGSLGLLLLDFDHFKDVNGTLGHAAGDSLLSGAAARLVAARRDDEMLVRLGGDEFAVLLPRLPEDGRGPAQARERARELLAVLAEPMLVGGVALTVEASVGVAVTSLQDDGCDTAELLRRAEVAMYQAKRTTGGIVAFAGQPDAGAVDRLAMAGELRTALEQSDQLVLRLQPSIDLDTGGPVGAEALIRWDHPRRGPMLPVDFVPLVEHTGLVRPFSRYVIDRALEVSSAWLAEGLRLPISVNLSARSLLDGDLPGDVDALLHTYGVPPELLVFEITETVVMSDLAVVEEVLGGLRDLGVKLSLDDFGTGYSSLAFLARVPVDELKIDRSFVETMGTREGAAIVRATVELGRALGLRVVAEGVERADQLATLTRLGCDAAQGNHLYPPMTVEDATDAVCAALESAERGHGPSVVPLRGRRGEER